MTGPRCSRSFTVLGAAGGTVFREVATAPADLGGRAAAVSGTVALTAGQTLYIVVGQSAGTNINGEPNTVGQFGGGGGGTFVFLGDLSSPLMVAGACRGWLAHAPHKMFTWLFSAQHSNIFACAKVVGEAADRDLAAMPPRPIPLSPRLAARAA